MDEASKVKNTEIAKELVSHPVFLVYENTDT